MSQRLVAMGLCVATIVGASAARAAEPIDFAKQIQPILVGHCAKCHNEKKAQAKLRLDSAAGIEEKWKADPELIVAGKPEESELFERLVLPADDKKRMPKGADPLAKESIDLIAEWIKQGAVLSATTAAVEPAKASEPAAKPTEKAKLAPPEVAAAPQAAIDKLTAAGARVMPLYAGSNLLDVSFAGRGEPASDADVALLAELAEQIDTLNLADAKVTAAGLAPLAGLKNLGRLHLERSSVGDAGLAHVAGLPRLEYLNLYGTTITDAGLPHLNKLPQLGRLYLWQTKVSYDTAMGLEQSVPGLVVNLGYDHPVVVRKHVTKELETAKAQAALMQADVTKLEQQLEQAKKGVEANTARVTELEKELKALDAPAKDAAPANGT